MTSPIWRQIFVIFITHQTRFVTSRAKMRMNESSSRFQRSFSPHSKLHREAKTNSRKIQDKVPVVVHLHTSIVDCNTIREPQSIEPLPQLLADGLSQVSEWDSVRLIQYEHENPFLVSV
jgi:hypothetical protein